MRRIRYWVLVEQVERYSPDLRIGPNPALRVGIDLRVGPVE